MKDDTRNVVLVFLSIVIVLVVVLGGGYYYLTYGDGLFQKSSTNKTTVPHKTIVTDSEIALSLDDKEVVDLLPIVDFTYSDKYKENFYKEDITYLSDVDNDIKIWIVLKKLGLPETITVNQLKKEYKKLYGSLDGYKKISKLDNCYYSYSLQKDKYVREENNCIYSSSAITKLAYARNRIGKNVDVVDIYEYVIFVDNSSEDLIYRYYSDYAKINLLIETAENINDTVMDNYSGAAGLYRYSFLKNKSGSYEFISVEKVN